AAAFFEVNRFRAARLKRYAEENSTKGLEIFAYQADFMDHIPAIASQIRNDDFAFILVDPIGYKELIPQQLAPLLQKRGVELLINLMWDFINRFWDSGPPVLDEIFGADRIERCKGPDREHCANKLFADRLRECAGQRSGRLYSATFPVQNRAKSRTHYFLVYATHSEKGLLAFAEVAEAI